MNISLNPHFETFIKNKIESGIYQSASEVIGDALRLLEEQEQIRALRLESLKKEIQQGIESGEATALDIEAIKQRGRAKLAAQK